MASASVSSHTVMVVARDSHPASLLPAVSGGPSSSLFYNISAEYANQVLRRNHAQELKENAIPNMAFLPKDSQEEERPKVFGTT